MTEEEPRGLRWTIANNEKNTIYYPPTEEDRVRAAKNLREYVSQRPNFVFLVGPRLIDFYKELFNK